MENTEYNLYSRDGLTLFGQTWLPKGEKKGLVLLIHGLGEHSGRYSHVGKMLVDAGYIMSAFDLRGHGKSGGKRGHSPSFESFMDDIDLFVEANGSQFPGIPKFFYGHSLGALFALVYALRRKPNLNGLIVTGPALRNELEKQRVKVAFIKLMNNIFPTLTIPTGLNVNHLARDKAVIEAYVNDALVHHQASLSMAKHSLEAIDWLFEHADDIHDPILIMQAREDKLCLPSSTQELIQKLTGDLTVKFWDDRYHEIHNDYDWDEVIGFMIDWLNNHIQ
jgi:alpha-beta hydrolase superfamily lysophospholipase